MAFENGEIDIYEVFRMECKRTYCGLAKKDENVKLRFFCNYESN